MRKSGMETHSSRSPSDIFAWFCCELQTNPAGGLHQDRQEVKGSSWVSSLSDPGQPQIPEKSLQTAFPCQQDENNLLIQFIFLFFGGELFSSSIEAVKPGAGNKVTY